MIDPDWLRRVLALAEADTGVLDAGPLAVLLAEPAEVLPYLFVHAQGFAAWPQARAAIDKAARNAVRPSSIRPDLARRPPPGSPDRDALYAALHAMITGEAMPPPGDDDEPEDGPDIVSALGLIGAVRIDEQRGDDAPSLFIEGD